MFMMPPVLAMLWPALTCNVAVLALPTLMVPVLVVLPAPLRVRRNASILTPPPLLRLRTACAASIVTAFPAAMRASSLMPGTMAHDQLPAVAQLPLAGFHVQAVASACCAGKASRMASRVGLTVKRGARAGIFVSLDRVRSVGRTPYRRKNTFASWFSPAHSMPDCKHLCRRKQLGDLYPRVGEGKTNAVNLRDRSRCFLGLLAVKRRHDANAPCRRWLVKRRPVVHNGRHANV